MPTKQEFQESQQRIFARPRQVSRVEQEILRSTQDTGVYQAPITVKSIRVDRIVPDPGQPRQTINEESLQELAASLRSLGQLTPIEVEYITDQDVFVIVDGERRWRAAQLAGLETLTCIVVGSLTQAERRERQIAALIHREDLNAVDRVRAITEYKELKGFTTWAEVARAVGLHEKSLSRLMAVDRLAAGVKDLIRQGRLSEKHTRGLKGLAEWRQEELGQAIAEAGLDAESARYAAQLMKEDPGLPAATAVERALAWRQQNEEDSLAEEGELGQVVLPPGQASNPLVQLTTAAQLLIHALDKLATGDDPTILPADDAMHIEGLLDEVNDRIDGFLARIQPSTTSEGTTVRRDSSSNGKPITNMPLWGEV
jgi:ParB family chromosome partitioning protein